MAFEYALRLRIGRLLDAHAGRHHHRGVVMVVKQEEVASE
jgi:hypothetical protein